MLPPKVSYTAIGLLGMAVPLTCGVESLPGLAGVTTSPAGAGGGVVIS